MYFHFCSVGRWFRRAWHHAARRRSKTSAPQTFSRTRGGFPALCHRKGREEHSLRSKNKQHQFKLWHAVMWCRLISEEPVFAVLNVTLCSSTLIESCLTAKSYSANKALFLWNKGSILPLCMIRHVYAGPRFYFGTQQIISSARYGS